MSKDGLKIPIDDNEIIKIFEVLIHSNDDDAITIGAKIMNRYIGALKNKDNIANEKHISKQVFDQILRERDTAVEQLNKLGYEFGEKVHPLTDMVSIEAMANFLAERLNCKKLEELLAERQYCEEYGTKNESCPKCWEETIRNLVCNRN